MLFETFLISTLKILLRTYWFDSWPVSLSETDAKAQHLRYCRCMCVYSKKDDDDSQIFS